MAYQQNFPIVTKREAAPGIFDVELLCPALANEAVPGQFVHIRVPEHLLRRPISICAVDRARGTLRIVFEVRGEGTRALAAFEPGEQLDVLGPLGNGFALVQGARAILVGGGIGVPPMLALAQHYGACSTAILGFRSAAAVILAEDFAAADADTRVCTDDGTRGERGFVTALLERRLAQGAADIVYACGPAAMLRGVAALAQAAGVRCQLSLEERMACGVGACLGCACKIKGEAGEILHKHVCKDGPVFEAGEVVL